MRRGLPYHSFYIHLKQVFLDFSQHSLSHLPRSCVLKTWDFLEGLSLGVWQGLGMNASVHFTVFDWCCFIHCLIHSWVQWVCYLKSLRKHSPQIACTSHASCKFGGPQDCPQFRPVGYKCRDFSNLLRFDNSLERLRSHWKCYMLKVTVLL